MTSIRFRPLALFVLSLLLTAFAAAAPPAAAIDLTALEGGGLVLAGHPDGGWLALTNDGGFQVTGTALEAVRVFPDGTVGESVTTEELHPIFLDPVTAAVAPSGRWLAVWKPESNDFVNSRFSAGIFEPDGTLVSRLDLEVPDERLVITEFRTAVAAVAPNGEFLLAWGTRTDETEPTFGTMFAYDLFLARFTQDGDRVAGPVLVNQERVGIQYPGGMVTNADSVAIEWGSNCCIEDGGEFEGQLRIFDHSLSPKTDVIQHSGGPNQSLGVSGMAFRPDGRLAIVSRGEVTPDGAASPVEVALFRSFEPDGTQAGPTRAVSTGLPGGAYRFAEATPDGTAWLVSWEEPDGPLLARLFTLDGMPVGPVRDTGFRDARDRFFEWASDPEGRLLIGYAEFLEPAVVTLVVGQAPPENRALTSPELPGFRVWVLIGGDMPNPRWGAEEPMCLAETLCASGALPGRTEVLVRVPGPKPNDFLWPTMVKLTTSSADVWIEQISTGEVQHYFLPGASPGNDVLNGLFDRTGFRP